MFFAILIFDPNWPLCKGYSLCILAIFANFQNGLISQILAAFCSRFLNNTTVMCLYSFFSHAFRNFNFWPKLTTLQRLWLLHVAIFANFQNALIFRILAAFWRFFFFCMKQLQYASTAAFGMFFAILIFDPNWPLCKGYSLCIVAIFGNFQNGLISQILAAFWSRFLHKTSLMGL